MYIAHKQKNDITMLQCLSALPINKIALLLFWQVWYIYISALNTGALSVSLWPQSFIWTRGFCCSFAAAHKGKQSKLTVFPSCTLEREVYLEAEPCSPDCAPVPSSPYPGCHSYYIQEAPFLFRSPTGKIFKMYGDGFAAGICTITYGLHTCVMNPMQMQSQSQSGVFVTKINS